MPAHLAYEIIAVSQWPKGTYTEQEGKYHVLQNREQWQSAAANLKTGKKKKSLFTKKNAQ